MDWKMQEYLAMKKEGKRNKAYTKPFKLRFSF
jgi:hypothetical protein